MFTIYLHPSVKSNTPPQAKNSNTNSQAQGMSNTRALAKEDYDIESKVVSKYGKLVLNAKRKQHVDRGSPKTHRQNYKLSIAARLSTSTAKQHDSTANDNSSRKQHAQLNALN